MRNEHEEVVKIFQHLIEQHVRDCHTDQLVNEMADEQCGDFEPVPNKPPTHLLDFLNENKWLDFRLLRAIQCIYSEKLDCIEEAIDLLQEYVHSRRNQQSWDRLRSFGISEARQRELEANPTPVEPEEVPISTGKRSRMYGKK